MEEGKVVICRMPGGRDAGEYKTRKIHGVHWSQQSGGVHKVSGCYHLYGYAPYSEVKDIVDCSGMHDFGYNDMKICILKSHNISSQYRKEYLKLERQAGEKPRSIISKNRPKGGIPCTNRILAILNTKSPITRGELRTMLVKEGYAVETFRGAAKRLYLQKLIFMEGAAYSPAQLIHLKTDSK